MQERKELLLEEGRAIRERVPRQLHREWNLADRREDPLAILKAVEAGRLSDLLPLRYGRMIRSPFSYMRGAAAVTAADVAVCPLTGIVCQACGDCHPANFGLFASPERRLLFDIIDCDETLQASWEFDLKRLTASLVMLAREQGCNANEERDACLSLVSSYRRNLETYAAQPPLDVWYASIDSDALVDAADDQKVRLHLQEFTDSARRHTAENLIERIISRDQQEPRFQDDPPTVRRLLAGSSLGDSLRTALESYPASLPEDKRVLLARYRLADVALKVVGVGSVGTRCGMALYMSETDTPLVLQIKEAYPSVLAKYVAHAAGPHEGQRIAVGQRIMQSASDIFLGWATDATGRPYYVRQLRDMKKSVPGEILHGKDITFFARACGWSLSRAHSKGGPGIVLSGYFGDSDHCDESLADFAVAYADQCEADYESFKKAVSRGFFPAEQYGAA